MKKILFYTDTPLLGGAENQMMLLAKFLPADKYSVTLACACNKSLNQWCRQFMELGVQVQRLKVLHKHDPRHYFYLRKLLPHFDLVHAHVWNPASCRFAMLAADKTPLVITEHDPFLLTGIKGWLKKKLVKNVKAIITASTAAKKLVLEQDASLEPLIHVIYNGIDIEEFKNQCVLENENEYKLANLARSLNDKIILCAAELHERKGQKFLIEAMKKIIAEFPNAILALAGEGSRRKFYEKLALPIKNNVVFLGRRKDIAKLMTVSDVFVLPSVREAFGLVILEAAVAGVPTVATRVGGIPEIIEDLKTGLLVDSQNPDHLAEAVIKILKNPAPSALLAKAAKERVKKRFNAREMALKTAEIYEKVIANR